MNDQKYFSLPEGAVLKGKYRIDAVLGRGGFGITYRGTETTIGLRIAIKEYYPYGYALRDTEESLSVRYKVDEGSRRAFDDGKHVFLEEARRLAQCDHIASVVGVREYFEENGTAYIVMEYLDGVTLKAYMKGGKQLEPARLCAMMVPLLRDLQKIHETGLVHRDISPDNIMLVDGRSLRLMDFGAARAFAEQGDEQHSLTVMLKQGYAPIEQYSRRGNQGPWTDVYAMAATIYACLTLREPEPSVDRMLEDRLALPSEVGVNISRRVEQVIMKNLSLQARERCQSAGEMADELEDALMRGFIPPEPEPSPKPPKPAPVRTNPGKKGRSPLPFIAAAAVLTVALAVPAMKALRPAEDSTSLLTPQPDIAEPEYTPVPEMTAAPAVAPTPTQVPTAEPTAAPTPTQAPTAEPTAAPTPTQAPTAEPTATPTQAPTPSPTAAPTEAPRVSGDTVFHASASSVYKLKYNSEYTVGADMAVDGNLKTAWNEGAEGRGIGEWIELRPTDGKKRLYEGFTIANGFQYHDYRKGDRWEKNNRVEMLGVYADGGYIGSYPVSDVYDGYDTIYFAQPVYAGTLRFVIEDTVYDADFGDTCISEIRPF